MEKNGKKKVKVHKKQVPLSLASAQALLHLVKEEITYIEVNTQIINELIGDLWEECNPEDDTTKDSYHDLNKCKTQKRANKIRVTKLAKISKELKDYLKAK